ncbi:hypothetical protein QVD17_37736 [Tagetes erecta]|uniref:Uncharacterized protein n=1 Tax=Tagetes erecta TaxID=13708 RepID=A0AAD8K133_TARER|nr:hypothetical protein QVD17_37736 [Tagetes erecta]
MTSGWLGLALDEESSIQMVCSKVYKFKGTGLRKKITALVTYSTIWTIWKTRNEWIFTKRAKTAGRLLEDVKLQSFNWINYRSSKLMVSWENWCKSPYEGLPYPFEYLEDYELMNASLEALFRPLIPSANSVIEDIKIPSFQ